MQAHREEASKGHSESPAGQGARPLRDQTLPTLGCTHQLRITTREHEAQAASEAKRRLFWLTAMEIQVHGAELDFCWDCIIAQGLLLPQSFWDYPHNDTHPQVLQRTLTQDTGQT